MAIGGRIDADWVILEVQRIAREWGDSRNTRDAQAAEMTLYETVLAGIAEGIALDPTKCAQEALKARQIPFPR